MVLIQAGTGDPFQKTRVRKEAPVADVILVVLIHNMLPTENSLNMLQKRNDNVIKEYQTQLLIPLYARW